MGNLAERIKEGSILIGICAIICGVMGGGLYWNIKKQEKQNAYLQSIKILDKNHDKKLDSNEIKLFYEEMKIDPYSLEAFKKIKTKQLEDFNSRYQEEYIKNDK